MDSAIYPLMREIEGSHWWFVVRRQLISDMLTKIGLPDDANILDAGCGTGGNLEMLASHGRVTGLEMEKSAADFSRERRIADIVEGYFPDNLPLSKDSFDLVTMIDVLEHIDDDHSTLSAVNTLLTRGGYALITVPAFQFLWSKHDEVHHHKRRYSKKQLINVIEESGLKLQYVSYFNTLLFPVAVAVRMVSKIFPFMQSNDGGDELPAPLINSILRSIFNTERTFLKILKFPYGLSLIAIVKKD